MSTQVAKIQSAYDEVLQRLPFDSEITYWLHFFAAGGTENEIRKDLTQTHEFAFEMNSIFKEKFHRTPEPGEFAACREIVISGSSISDLAQSIVERAA